MPIPSDPAGLTRARSCASPNATSHATFSPRGVPQCAHSTGPAGITSSSGNESPQPSHPTIPRIDPQPHPPPGRATGTRFSGKVAPQYSQARTFVGATIPHPPHTSQTSAVTGARPWSTAHDPLDRSVERDDVDLARVVLTERGDAGRVEVGDPPRAHRGPLAPAERRDGSVAVVPEEVDAVDLGD